MTGQDPRNTADAAGSGPPEAAGAPELDPPEVAVEVPGTPEQVWALIATGPGISTWFMPADVDPREGGALRLRHAAGDDGVTEGRISAYEPPRRFVYEDDLGGETYATEFLVEARSGGTCSVRVVTHGLTADDAAFREGLVSGWTQALATLRVHLEHFAGLPAGSGRLWSEREGTLDEAWVEVMSLVGLDGVARGEAIERTGGSHPPFAGTVELVQDRALLLLLRARGPHPGVLGFIATDFGGRVSLVVDRYVYGEGAQAAADEEARAWAGFLGPRSSLR